MHSHPRYRSLYWRIAAGFMACIATVLAIQALVVVWLLNRTDNNQVDLQTGAVAAQIAEALTANPNANLDTVVREQNPSPPRPFYVVMNTGQLIAVGYKPPSDRAVQTVRDRFYASPIVELPIGWVGEPYHSSPVIFGGEIIGLVAVVPLTLVEQLGPMVFATAAGLLVLGTAVTSVFVFRPAHRRLKNLEAAALRLGAGDLAARADDAGGDEVSSLSHTFNGMAEDLMRRAEQVAAADRTRRLLLADVSHELMTPLTAVRGYQEKLAADPVVQASGERSRFVEIIGDETQRIERVVKDLLDLAKLESGPSALDLQDVAVEGLFGRLVARHGEAAAARQVRLVSTVAAGAELVYGDPFRLEQALQNLTANALRHTPPGGTITITATSHQDDMVFTVTDTGTGIAAEHLPYVFDRFYKADPSRSNQGSNSGLGLSIVKAIAQVHGGTVAVSSAIGRGTTFTFRFAGSPEAVSSARPQPSAGDRALRARGSLTPRPATPGVRPA